MLFGMFFGAGNMIFPAALGVSAGNNILYAFGGMFLTAVGLPLLAVAALGITRTGSVLEIGTKVSGKFGLLFSLLLYLTIGPLFAVPRCASTPPLPWRFFPCCSFPPSLSFPVIPGDS